MLYQSTRRRCCCSEPLHDARHLYRKLASNHRATQWIERTLKHREVVKKLLYKCTREELMHVAAWCHETPGPKFTKFRDWPDPNATRFRCASTKMFEISVRPLWKSCSLEKAKVHCSSPDLSPIDRPYVSFYRQSVITLALDCFVFRDIADYVSQVPLLRIPPPLSPKMWRYSPRISVM